MNRHGRLSYLTNQGFTPSNVYVLLQVIISFFFFLFMSDIKIEVERDRSFIRGLHRQAKTPERQTFLL